MGFEFSHGQKLQVKEWNGSSFPTLDTKRVVLVSSRHNRSKSSDSYNRVEEESSDLSPVRSSDHRRKLDMGQKVRIRDVRKKSVPANVSQSSLKKEVLHLKEQLQGQFDERRAMEMALGYRSAVVDTSNDNSMPKFTKELIREIAILELEVMHLEQYLLSLYRKAYDQQAFPLSPVVEDQQKSPPTSQHKVIQEVPRNNIPSEQASPPDLSSHAMPPCKMSSNPSHEANIAVCSEKLNGPGAHRSHSALSQRAVHSAIMSSRENCVTGFSERFTGPGVNRSHSALSQRAVSSALMSPHEYHSQPLSFLESGRNATSQVISLAEYLGTRIADHVPETPNRLSEDMVRCMGSIYSKLVEPPLVYPGVSSSPTSSFSSMSAHSPQYPGDMWSPVCRKVSSYDVRLENPFQTEGFKEFSGPYSAMVEVPSICTDIQGLSDVEDLLKYFRSLTHRLEKVDVRKMKNEEKLAFWINIHNALMMHAYVQYGIPQNYLKKSSLLLKATCNIGGRVINVDTIQSSILGHRTYQPGQWIRTLFSPKLKLRTGDEWQAYAIEHPEPLLHFALCSGSHSDPAVRIYTPKKVFQHLETAKEEYIRAAVSVRKEQKILLPKVVESFAKHSSLSQGQTLEMIQHYMPETLKMAMQRCQVGKSQKCIEWVPHNFAFRYLLMRELTGPLIN